MRSKGYDQSWCPYIYCILYIVWTFFWNHVDHEGVLATWSGHYHRQLPKQNEGSRHRRISRQFDTRDPCSHGNALKSLKRLPRWHRAFQDRIAGSILTQTTGAGLKIPATTQATVGEASPKDKEIMTVTLLIATCMIEFYKLTRSRVCAACRLFGTDVYKTLQLHYLSSTMHVHAQ